MCHLSRRGLKASLFQDYTTTVFGKRIWASIQMPRQSNQVTVLPRMLRYDPTSETSLNVELLEEDSFDSARLLDRGFWPLVLI